MEFLMKMIFATFMVMTFCCQKMVASPLGSRELSETSNDNLNELEEIINSELEPLSRNRRYVVIQVMGKLAHGNDDHITRRHPRHHRFNHRRHYGREQLKKI